MKIKVIISTLIFLFALALFSWNLWQQSQQQYFYTDAKVIIPKMTLRDGSDGLAGITRDKTDLIKNWYNDLMSNKQVVSEWKNTTADSKIWKDNKKTYTLYIADKEDKRIFLFISSSHKGASNK